MKAKFSKAELLELDALLPWYVNGTLDPDEMARIEAALKQNGQLRTALEIAQSDADAIRSAAAELGAPSRAVLDRIMASTAPSLVRSTHASLMARFKDFVVSLSPRTLALASAAAMLLLVVQGISLGRFAFDDGRGTGPELASDEQGTQSSQGLVIVKFAEGASLAKVASALQDLDLVIVDGPTADGLFVIGYRNDAISKLSAAELVSRLSDDSGLTQFAVPMTNQ